MIRVNFEFLSETLVLDENPITVLCVENNILYRKIFAAFINDTTEENKIVFSENFIPVKSKGNICLIDEYFRLSYSNSLIKKLYAYIEAYCNDELHNELQQLKTQLVNFASMIENGLDYDVDFNDDIGLAEILKLLNIKPAADSNELLETLINYILTVNKYAPPKCFVLINLHMYFSREEIDLFYKDIINNHIRLLVIENKKCFEKSDCEKLIIYDDDFCEIIENQ